MTTQVFPGQQQNFLTNHQLLQEHSSCSQQLQMFISNQPPNFLPNLQHLMFSTNPREPNINLNQQQQMGQYNQQQLG